MRTPPSLLRLVPLLVLLTASPLAAGEGDLVTRRFDVGALVEARPHARTPVLGAGPTNWHEEPRSEADDLPFIERDSLVEVVRNTVDPASWDAVEGSSLQATGRWLEARHRSAVLDRVGTLLRALEAEARRGLTVAVEVRSAPATAWPSAGGGATLLESGSVSSPFGVTGAVLDTNRVTYVGDYDVEIAQGSMIANPIVVAAEEGLVVEALAHPTSDGRRAVLELLVQRAAYGPSRLLETGIDEEYLAEPYRSLERLRNGRVELPTYEHLQAHLTAVVEAGATVSVPCLLGDRLIEVRGRVGPLPGPVAGHALFSLGALGGRPWPVVFGVPDVDEGLLRRAAPRVRFPGEEPGEAPGGDPEYLVESIRTTLAPSYWEEGGDLTLWPGGRLWARGPEYVRDGVRSLLAEREADALRPVEVELRVFSVPAVPDVGAGAAVPREGARLLAGCRLSTLSGRRASVMAGSTANVLVEYDVEVAQEARIADPIVGQAFDGLVANLTPRVASDGSSVTIDLRLLRSRRRIAEEPFDSGARYLGPLDRVSTDRALVNAVLEVPAGGTHVVDMGGDPDEPSRRVALEVAATLR